MSAVIAYVFFDAHVGFGWDRSVEIVEVLLERLAKMLNAQIWFPKFEV